MIGFCSSAYIVLRNTENKKKIRCDACWKSQLFITSNTNKNKINTNSQSTKEQAQIKCQLLFTFNKISTVGGQIFAAWRKQCVMQYHEKSAPKFHQIIRDTNGMCLYSLVLSLRICFQPQQPLTKFWLVFWVLTLCIQWFQEKINEIIFLSKSQPAAIHLHFCLMCFSFIFIQLIQTLFYLCKCKWKSEHRSQVEKSPQFHIHTTCWQRYSYTHRNKIIGAKTENQKRRWVAGINTNDNWIYMNVVQKNAWFPCKILFMINFEMWNKIRIVCNFVFFAHMHLPHTCVYI